MTHNAAVRISRGRSLHHLGSGDSGGFMRVGHRLNTLSVNCAQGKEEGNERGRLTTSPLPSVIVGSTALAVSVTLAVSSGLGTV